MMRIRFCLLIMLFAGRYALAQDVIVKQDGGTILSKVLEIGTQEIAYKKWNSQDGPVYKIAKDQVLSVNYQNGEVDRFACPSDNPRPEELPVVDVSPAEDNAMRIALYNNSIRSRKNETPGKFAARYTYKFGMSSNSVLSSEDLDISIVLNGNGNGSWYNAPYLIKIRNKTDGFIYIDLANCFKIYPDGSYRCYYDTKQTTISSGTGSGVSLGLGAVANAFDVGGIAGTLANGLAVGTGSSKSASTTYAQNRILTVPPMATANLTEEKKELLRGVFWDMNTISHQIGRETITEIVVQTDEKGNAVEKEQTVEKTVLTVSVTHKPAEEMAARYFFNPSQKAALTELLAPEFDTLLTGVLSGMISDGGGLVAVARSQVGNIGGELYWSWYGFESHVEWCACFVSWCADQCGYIDAGLLPKFAACTSQGVPWFQERGQWQDNTYTPNPGDLIFFNWDQDEWIDHVGIVEKVENGRIYTIEGNSGNACEQNSYPLGDSQIYGYGILRLYV